MGELKREAVKDAKEWQLVLRRGIIHTRKGVLLLFQGLAFLIKTVTLFYPFHKSPAWYKVTGVKRVKRALLIRFPLLVSLLASCFSYSIQYIIILNCFYFFNDLMKSSVMVFLFRLSLLEVGVSNIYFYVIYNSVHFEVQPHHCHSDLQLNR